VLTKSVALEYGKQNIRANVVAPASMVTTMGETRGRLQPGRPGSRAASLRGLLAERPIGRPDEPAAVGVWLLLDAPTHVNGIVVPVDGGRGAV
jgi:NAD(P)-dependent dehydrogenase (short-subunit alcohol dehydrogenase family)